MRRSNIIVMVFLFAVVATAQTANRYYDLRDTSARVEPLFAPFYAGRDRDAYDRDRLAASRMYVSD